MRRLLLALPLVVMVAAAADTLFVRERLSHRELDPALFLQSALIWLVFALIALWPARLWIARREKSGRAVDAVAGAATLAFVTLAPVLVHWRLDAFSDLGGGLAGLKRPLPWLETAGALIVLWACLAGLKWLAPRLHTPRLAAALCVASLGLGLFSNPWHERADTTSTAAAGKPNLLLLIWDTTRAQSLSFYGYDRRTTPSLEALANESIVFDAARSASRYTLTSHLSMLTGVYPSHHGARMTRQRISPHDTPSIAATLRDHGYRTAAFVGTGVLSAPTGVGFGFEHYDDQVDPPVCDTLAWALVHDLQSILASFGPPFSQNGQPHWIQDFFRPANEVLAKALKWIDDGDPRPWFCMINLYDAHWPYRPEAAASAKWVEAYDGVVDGFHLRSDKYPRGVLFGGAPVYGFHGPGVLLQGTTPGSPAEKAGLQAGDILLEIGDTRTDSVSDFTKALGLCKPREAVAVRYSRAGVEASSQLSPGNGYQMQARDDAHLRELYDAELFDLDIAVDRFLAKLDLQKGKTALLMCADHGEAFGEGGRYEHNDILEPQVHIPFLVRASGAANESARRVSTPVSGVDVAPTLLALAGVAAPATYIGIDALSLVDPAEYVKRSILVEDRDQLDATDIRLALYDGPWKLVRRGLGAKIRYQLFDLDRDPIGLTDVLDKEPEIAARMKSELDELRARWHADDKKDQEGTGYSNADALRGMGYAGN